ncbi:hypothetical protein COCSUDRAFT_58590 [Coccomyxa subellipsoidea C-169]|uniref:Uncharacterized protein n=1 Tax=Coccomyxa subellipsoidea (strain C-169) TaxID=574566 RepID=I0YLM6_COCSC|nr:hypothetical protein COCSUDRAFT_58590 [Coccomyxa subellipsoidea C-169]EIE19295.1 hypothetical protein COCSUDRAFT_58590 [Coccomyxa subellipsoidea C-169]|eukprot:XP_005643839.1 hypothetical protein COCSUDRAFT_58590 [Coccomyxa subellipsoidea C-169]
MMWLNTVTIVDNATWENGVSLANLRAALKQVLVENELLKLRIVDARCCNMRAATLLAVDGMEQEIAEPGSPPPAPSSPSLAPSSPTPNQRFSYTRRSLDE